MRAVAQTSAYLERRRAEWEDARSPVYIAMRDGEVVSVHRNRYLASDRAGSGEVVKRQIEAS